MCTETSIKYGQNKCAQKFLSSMDIINVHRIKNCSLTTNRCMDKINVHRNFYRVWTQKMCTETSINDGQNKCAQKKNGDTHDDSQTG